VGERQLREENRLLCLRGSQVIFFNSKEKVKTSKEKKMHSFLQIMESLRASAPTYRNFCFASSQNHVKQAGLELMMAHCHGGNSSETMIEEAKKVNCFELHWYCSHNNP